MRVVALGSAAGCLLFCGVAFAAAPRSVALDGRVLTVSTDAGSVAAKVEYPSGTLVCSAAVVWQEASNRVTRIGKPSCLSGSNTDQSFDSLTIAGGRVAWADYSFGNHTYCTGLFTATVARPKPLDLGACDGTAPDTLYDLAGSGPLLVAREYLQCEADCAPDYSGTYQTSITLYQVTDELAKIGPLKRDTHLFAVNAGRLLLADGKKLEVVTPHQGSSARFITGDSVFGQSFLSGGDVLGVAGPSLAQYDASTGALVANRSLPARAKVVGFAEGVVAYTNGNAIHVLRLADGRDKTVATVPGLAASSLDSAGLFYGYDRRLAFLSFSSLTRLLG